MTDTLPFQHASAFHRSMRRFAATGPGSWMFKRVQHHLDRPVFRMTNGRHTIASLVSGLPVVMVATTGARSGARREVPVLGLPTPQGVAVIASSYGQERHPAWYYNLRANLDCEVTVDGVTRRCRARMVEGEERERIWRQGLEIYPGWGVYERRAPNRRIAVFVLEESSSGSQTGPAAGAD